VVLHNTNRKGADGIFGLDNIAIFGDNGDTVVIVFDVGNGVVQQDSFVVLFECSLRFLLEDCFETTK
jgi:hypothetical protein